MQTDQHKPIPVAEAKRIAEQYSASRVVILAYQPASGLTHTTTYGVSPKDKEDAADAGDSCTRLLCGAGFNLRRPYEDYRFLPAGEVAAWKEKVLVAVKAADYLCLSLLAVREGATDELIREVQDALQDVLASAPSLATNH